MGTREHEMGVPAIIAPDSGWLQLGAGGRRGLHELKRTQNVA